MDEEDLNDLQFDRRRAPKAQVAAVTELATKLGQPVETLDGVRMGEIVDLAKQAYGKELPEYWRVWIDWSQNLERPEMGDL